MAHPDRLGETVRQKALAHAQRQLDANAVWVAAGGEGEAFTVRQLIDDAIDAWPAAIKARERAASRNLDAD